MAQVELHCLINEKEYKYTGRFLGFIKDDEFNAICQSKKAAGKIESKETKPLIDVCQKYDIKVHLNFCPKLEDDKNHALKKVLDMFERVTA